MIVTILFKDDNMFVSEMATNKKIKKIHHYKMLNLLNDDGEIANPRTAAEFLLEKLKQDKVKVKKVGICMDRRGVVCMNLSIPVVKKKLLGQMVRLAVDEKYPGTLNSNAMTFKVYGIENGHYNISILLVSKKIANSYAEFAKSMKVKVGFVDAYPNIMSKSLRGLTQYPEDVVQKEGVQTLAVSVHQREFQVLVLNNYDIMYSTTVALPLTYSLETGNKIKVDKIYHSISQTLATIDSGDNLEIYLDAGKFLTDEDSQELDKIVFNEFNSRVNNIDKTYSKMLDEFFFAANDRAKNEYEEFNLKNELHIQDPNSFLGINKLLYGATWVFAVATVGAGGLYIYHQVRIGQHEDVIAEKEAYIASNAYIDELIRERDALASKLQFSELVDTFAHHTRIDFEEVERTINSVYMKHGASIQNINFPSSLNYSIQGIAKNYANIANIMNELETIDNMLYAGVVLTSITPMVGLDGSEEIQFTLQSKYNLYGRVASQLSE